jgi:hypothetical protein
VQICRVLEALGAIQNIFLGSQIWHLRNGSHFLGVELVGKVLFFFSLSTSISAR